MHAHKLLGVFALAHFAYRFRLFATRGAMAFDRSPATAACLAAHALLHATAFQFALPARRNLAHNIIFPEMRWHTTIFGMRAIACMAVAVFLSPRWSFLNTVIAMLTMVLADVATRVYARPGVPATTMMRDNPFPPYVSPRYARAHNLFYAVAQVGATVSMVFAGPDAMFVTLIPIQVAPLLMTLTKKGVLSRLGWHVGYTATLLMAYYRGAFSPDARDMRLAIVPLWAVIAFFAVGRFWLRSNKYAMWALTFALGEFLSKPSPLF